MDSNIRASLQTSQFYYFLIILSLTSISQLLTMMTIVFGNINGKENLVAASIIAAGITMSNIQNSDFYNIRFQKKPFMIWIWISAMLISLGGFVSVFKKRTNLKKKIIYIIISLIFIFLTLTFYKGLKKKMYLFPVN